VSLYPDRGALADAADNAVSSISAADHLAEALLDRARRVDQIARACTCGAHRATALTTQDEDDFGHLRRHLDDAREELRAVDDLGDPDIAGDEP